MQLFDIPLGHGRKLLYKRTCTNCTQSAPGALQAARALLAGLQTNGGALSKLRAGLFALSKHSTSASQLYSADNPIRMLKGLLDAGDYHLCTCDAVQKGSAGAGGGSGAKASNHGTSARKSPTPVARKLSPQASSSGGPTMDDASVLTPMVDPVATARVQQLAAKLGIPFIEECLTAHKKKASS